MRSLSGFAVALLCLAGCQQGGKTNAAGNAANANAAAAAPVAPANAALPTANAASTTTEAPAIAVPASYDWTFDSHGGSGELVFGDGDLAEGVSLVTLSCLPGSNTIQSSGEADARLRSGQVTVVIAPNREIAVGHPVLRDLQASGTVTLINGNETRVLTAKPGAGRIAIESFMSYCAAG